ncbi:DUF4199 domain-containing protein [uncultured Winogradskyella sp.]|uniref:DUF4199 domain-containing protein n=1 Tax=uncultured Winogradskyella sp. TaxID=395353 RepID=UPI002618A96E|nr:DUF4199 domain-containing protein [uncultured Winogradskyella sp.]
MKKQIIKYSCILSSICILYFISTNLLGISGDEIIGWFGYLPYIFVIYFGINLSPILFSTYKSKFMFGTKVGGIGAIVSSLFMFVYLKFVSNLMIETVIKNQIALLDPSSSSYETTVETITNTITPNFYLIFGIIVGIILSLIFSSIIPLIPNFLKK